MLFCGSYVVLSHLAFFMSIFGVTISVPNINFQSKRHKKPGCKITSSAHRVLNSMYLFIRQYTYICVPIFSTTKFRIKDLLCMPGLIQARRNELTVHNVTHLTLLLCPVHQVSQSSKPKFLIHLKLKYHVICECISQRDHDQVFSLISSFNINHLKQSLKFKALK
jgi:hypothetical protein